MSERNKKKLDISGSDGLGQNPFGALSGEGLAKGLPAEQREKPTPKPQKSKGRVEVRREKAGRGGKTVTTLKEFPTHIPLVELEKMTKGMKQSFACGGVLKGRVIELQGDVCDQVIAALSERGYKPVRAGG
jgi:translation initiation factor 1